MTDFQGCLKLNIKTWARDSHGLFDYEAPTTKNNQLIIQGTCKLIRKKNDVRFLSENSEIEFEERELAKIIFDENSITIVNPLTFLMIPTETNINELQNKIWHVIKHDDNSNESPSSIQSTGIYEIKINDIIKLGRVKYAITEMKINDKLETIDKNVENPVFELISEYKKIDIATSQDVICKICYHNMEEATNPMINLCKCTGSISSIHFSCLKKWMNTKLTTKENEKKTVLSYSMKAFNCEICMTPYPLRFKSDHNEYDIIDLMRPTNKNYIILESLNQLKERNNYKSIQVVTLKENEKILMGRGHETDVRINDISVSRSHANLIQIDNIVYIKDLRSKFGTLVLAQKNIEIKNKQLNLQIGRSFIEFSLTKDNVKNKKETLSSKASINSSQSNSSVEEKMSSNIFKRFEVKIFEEKKINNMNDSLNLIKSSLFEIEGEKSQQNGNLFQCNQQNNNNNSTQNVNLSLNNSNTNNINNHIINQKEPSLKNIFHQNSINNLNNIKTHNIFNSNSSPLLSNFTPLNLGNNGLNHEISQHQSTNKIKNNQMNMNSYYKSLNLIEDLENKTAILQNPFIDINNKINSNRININGTNFPNNLTKEFFNNYYILNNTNANMNTNSQNLFSVDCNKFTYNTLNNMINSSNEETNINSLYNKCTNLNTFPSNNISNFSNNVYSNENEMNLQQTLNEPFKYQQLNMIKLIPNNNMIQNKNISQLGNGNGNGVNNINKNPFNGVVEQPKNNMYDCEYNINLLNSLSNYSNNFTNINGMNPYNNSNISPPFINLNNSINSQINLNSSTIDNNLESFNNAQNKNKNVLQGFGNNYLLGNIYSQNALNVNEINKFNSELNEKEKN